VNEVIHPELEEGQHLRDEGRGRGERKKKVVSDDVMCRQVERKGGGRKGSREREEREKDTEGEKRGRREGGEEGRGGHG